MLTVCLRSPKECTTLELNTYENLVIKGGQVSKHGLHERIGNAEFLSWIKDDNGEMVGVGAVKNPLLTYVDHVFKKAESNKEPNQYTLELGWIYIKPEFCGRGLSITLISKLLSSIGKKAIFATTKENNAQMRKNFKKFDFLQSGNAFPPDKGTYKLLLFTKN